MYKIAQIKYKSNSGENINSNIINHNTNLLQLSNINSYSVVQMGIQAPPGTMIIINGLNIQSNNAIEIGQTGIFEINLKDNNTYISYLSMAIPSALLDSNNLLKEGKVCDVIIDILYEEGGI